MSSQSDYLQKTTAKFKKEPHFMAYVLNRYCEIEQISEEEHILHLKCNTESYYKLGLCTRPDAEKDDFAERIKNISSYVTIPESVIQRMIRRVSTFDALFSNSEELMMMAARDKHKKKKNP